MKMLSTVFVAGLLMLAAVAAPAAAQVRSGVGLTTPGNTNFGVGRSAASYDFQRYSYGLSGGTSSPSSSYINRLAGGGSSFSITRTPAAAATGGTPYGPVSGSPLRTTRYAPRGGASSVAPMLPQLSAPPRSTGGALPLPSAAGSLPLPQAGSSLPLPRSTGTGPLPLPTASGSRPSLPTLPGRSPTSSARASRWRLAQDEPIKTLVPDEDTAITAFLRQADTAFREGRYQDAGAAYRNAGRIDTANADVLFGQFLSSFASSSGVYAVTAVTLAQAVRLQPDLLNAPVKISALYGDDRQNEYVRHRRLLDSRLSAVGLDSEALLVRAVLLWFDGERDRAWNDLETLQRSLGASEAARRQQPLLAAALQELRRTAEAARAADAAAASQAPPASQP